MGDDRSAGVKAAKLSAFHRIPRLRGILHFHQIVRRSIKTAFRLLLISLILAACRSPSNGPRKSIARGVDYFRIEMAHPNVVHVLVWDTENSDVRLKPVLSGNVLRRAETLSSLIRSSSDSVIAGINGDFFSQENIPSGLLILNGRPVKNTTSGWAVFGITPDDELFIDHVSLTGYVSFSGMSPITIDGFNRPRGDGETIWYNSYFGKSTQTNVYGIEVRMMPQDHTRTIGKKNPYRIVEIDTTGNGTLDDSSIVVSLHGSHRESLIRSLQTGMEAGVQIEGAPGPPAIRDAVGGFPQLVRNGRIDIQPSESTPFFVQRYPRSAVGYSRGRKRVWLVCVDGSQPNYSVGMTMEELAQLMVGLGADRAINLDGGGSSTMIVRGSVVNRPSTGVERPVANALLLVKR